MTVALLCLFGTSAVIADVRVALVIGNSQYRSFNRLPNPASDASKIAALLKSSGFDTVELHLDVDRVQLRSIVGNFAEVSRKADVAVVYFAGHGIEIDGANFLIPVDAVLQSDFDVEDEALSLERVLRVIGPARRLRFVILDACRDNPFIARMKRTGATRSVGRGLSRVEPTATDTIVAFAAKAGTLASDGDGENSPFTAALLDHLTTPGLDVRLALGMVRDDVMKATSNRQEPFVYGSLGGSIVALNPSSGDGSPRLDPKQPAQSSPAPAGPKIEQPSQNAQSNSSKEQTALIADPSLGRPNAPAPFDRFRGATFDVTFTQVIREIAPLRGTWPTQRRHVINVISERRITTVRSLRAFNGAAGTYPNTAALGEPGDYAGWWMDGDRLVAREIQQGRAVALNISLVRNGDTCVANVAFDLAPGAKSLTLPRLSNGDVMQLAWIRADNVACRVKAPETNSDRSASAPKPARVRARAAAPK